MKEKKRRINLGFSNSERNKLEKVKNLLGETWANLFLLLTKPVELLNCAIQLNYQKNHINSESRAILEEIEISTLKMRQILRRKEENLK